jgi:hypothetical protein
VVCPPEAHAPDLHSTRSLRRATAVLALHSHRRRLLPYTSVAKGLSAGDDGPYLARPSVPPLWKWPRSLPIAGVAGGSAEARLNRLDRVAVELGSLFALPVTPHVVVASP